MAKVLLFLIVAAFVAGCTADALIPFSPSAINGTVAAPNFLNPLAFPLASGGLLLSHGRFNSNPTRAVIFTDRNTNLTAVNYTGTVPTTRYATTYCTSPDNTRGFLFGGFTTVRAGDLFLLDLTTYNWSSPAAPATKPSIRTLGGCVWRDADTVWLHGGKVSDAGFSNDMWVYTVSNNTWTAVTTQGTPPSPHNAFAHATNPDKSLWYLFGGQTTNGVETAEFAVFSFENATWLSVTSRPELGARIDATYGTLNNVLYIFGGFVSGTASPPNSSLSLDLTTGNLSVSATGLPSFSGGVAFGSTAEQLVYVLGGGASSYNGGYAYFTTPTTVSGTSAPTDSASNSASDSASASDSTSATASNSAAPSSTSNENSSSSLAPCIALLAPLAMALVARF